MDNEPPQDKTCCLGRFLDSHSFARNDMSVGGSGLPARVLFGTLLGDESSPLHCIIPFNRTGYIRNVAGGRLPPLRTHRFVIPFIRMGSIRNAPGTAHRPFPTVSLGGGSVQLHGLYSKRGMAMNHRRYIAWLHSTAQVIFETWRAADCRPYTRYVIPTALFFQNPRFRFWGIML